MLTFGYPLLAIPEGYRDYLQRCRGRQRRQALTRHGSEEGRRACSTQVQLQHPEPCCTVLERPGNQNMTNFGPISIFVFSNYF